MSTQPLTPEQINVLIAESLGWEDIHNEVHPAITYYWGYPRIDGQLFEDREMIPDFYNSLDACAAFERTLTDEEWQKYRQTLWVVAAGSTREAFKRLPENERLSRGRAYHSATAPQRCEAFLRVKGLWTPPAPQEAEKNLP